MSDKTTDIKHAI